MKMKQFLMALQADNKIRAIDYRFALLMQEQDKDAMESEQLLLLAALLSFELGKGNVCIDIKNINKPFDFPEHELPIVIDVKHCENMLRKSLVVGLPGEKCPMILDGHLLYLNRYWCYETEVAAAIKKRMGNQDNLKDDNLKSVLTRLFEGGSAVIDWQKIAAAIAIRDKFSVITGGPGTGKTTTVTRLLALLLEQAEYKGQQQPLIKLVAPTGKAAARLSESIKGAKQQLNCSDVIKHDIPDEASTIHRLLAVVPNSPHFRHNKNHPLLIDVLVVDEASMVDLPLMAKLLESLPDSCRVILLGDKDQLSSVEAGSVLGDICGGEKNTAYSKSLLESLSEICDYQLSEFSGEGVLDIADSIANLRDSHRFDNNSGIKKLADAVNGGDTQQSKKILTGAYEDIQFFPPTEHSYVQLIEQAVEGYRHYLELLNRSAAPQDILKAFNQFRVLCALRAGDFGVQLVNARIEQALFRKGLISAAAHDQWYAGRPVMVTENDYGVGLYNGDIGIAIKDAADNQLRILFIMPDGTQRRLSPSRLPAHETVYAMTVHKSQGSEYDQVVMVLPKTFTPLLSRELLYTGITRARSRFVLYADTSIVTAAIASPTIRMSGLRSRLWTDKM